MKRDMELVRNLLLQIAEADRPIDFESLVKDGDDSYKVAYHMEMLINEAHLVKGIDARTMDGRNWIDLTLTWSGQDFVDSIRDPTVWEKTTKGVKKLGGVSFDIFVRVAKEYAKAELQKILGLNLGE
jgi:Hypothetical protein (DUF2513)